MTPHEQLGYDLARGALRYIGLMTLIVILGWWAVRTARNLLGSDVDDSDRSAWDRSGLRVYTDAKTGVQYLSTPDGAIIVRVDSSGKPITTTPPTPPSL